MKNLNDEFFGEFFGGGAGWFGFQASYIITAGVRAMTLKYEPIIGLLNRLIEIAEELKPQSLAVINIEVSNHNAHIKFSSLFNDYDEQVFERDYTLEPGLDDCSITLYLGLDNIFCLPCED
jgi:hypothetical protein